MNSMNYEMIERRINSSEQGRRSFFFEIFTMKSWKCRKVLKLVSVNPTKFTTVI